MKYKLIAVDLDGTLLNDEKLICDYNFSRINKAIDMGVKFVLCSGRLRSGLEIYHKMVGQEQPIICCNGSIVVDDKGKIIYNSPMSKSSIIKIIDIIRERKKDTYYNLYDENIAYTENFSEILQGFYRFKKQLGRDFKFEVNIVPDLKSTVLDPDRSINKMVIIDGELEYLEHVREKLQFVSNIEITSSDITNIEIMKKDVSKGAGIEILSRHLGIPIEECIVVGNDQNDMSMIKTKAFGVAVANSITSLKESADYVTLKDNNQGAIGEIIDKFIINQ